MNFWYNVRNLVKEEVNPIYHEPFELDGGNYPVGCQACREIRKERIVSLVVGDLNRDKKVERFNFHQSCLDEISESVLSES
ncbi:hypothetical protein HYX17_03120 [Candidatus Woesearchaeota archaeon]|nr:hypothetical protein [Candidatus Woesearchaeota archaeon]